MPSFDRSAINLPCFTLAVMVALSACSHQARAPVTQKQAGVEVTRQNRVTGQRAVTAPANHRVVRGDTLYAIAFRYGLDFRDLVRWNNIRNPDFIVVGQTLRLRAPAPVAKSPASRAPPPARAAAPAPASRTPKPAAPVARQVDVAPLTWQWPATGKVSATTRVSGARGIEIRGSKGQSIKAATGGVVVYSGSGLRGYGELIIVKHNETFLSAYAHNEARLVEEGRRVSAGQEIARMGNTEARDVMLHFEIRRNGKTVDPLQYLPRR